jgi:hypothetical protein
VVNRRRFLVELTATLAGAVAVAGSTGRLKARPVPPVPATAAAQPATTTTTIRPTTTSSTTSTTSTRVAHRTPAPQPAALKRPMPGPEPFPASNYPPRTTVTLTGAQTAQYRPNGVSNRIFDLRGAVWHNTPVHLPYPIVVDDAGSNTPDGHNTILKGATINGNLDRTRYRGDNYDAYHSGIEHNCDSATGWIIGDRIRVDNMMDGYRFKGQGDGYLKRSWFSNISDDALELEDIRGNVFVYDCLWECVTAFSDRDGTAAPLPTSRLEVDGLLCWIKPQKDRVHSSGEFQGCSGTGAHGGCQELADSGRFSFAIWKGGAVSRPTVVVRNSWFRIDRMSCYGASSMAWPGAGLTWGHGSTSHSYKNVKLLWTGLDLAGNPSRAPYPGPPLPPGVQLVSGREALDMWESAAAAWKADHGYR